MATTPRQLVLPFPHEPDYAQWDFLAAASNAEALAWLDGTAQWPCGRLAVWGEAGCGKTHLLHRWRPALLLDGAAGHGMPAPPPGPVAVDDAERAEPEWLLHLLNAAAEAGHPVLLAAHAPPSRWAVAPPDLVSRLRATAAVRIGPPDDALLRALLARLLAARQLAVPEPLQDWLLLRLPRSAGAMRCAAVLLDRLGLAAGGRVTRPVAAEVAAELGDAGRVDSPAQAGQAVSSDTPGLL